LGFSFWGTGAEIIVAYPYMKSDANRQALRFGVEEAVHRIELSAPALFMIPWEYWITT
jgi:hypothetical protein